MSSPIHRFAPIAAGLGLAALVGTLLDRVLAAWVLDASARSLGAWLAALGLQTALVGLAALGLGWLRMVERAAGRRRGRHAMRLMAGVAAFAGLLPMGAEITSGAWISAQPFAPVLRVGLPGAGAIAAVILVALGQRWPATDERPHARAFTVALWLAGMAVPVAELWLVAPGGFLHTHATAVVLAPVLLCAAALRLAAQAPAPSGRTVLAPVPLLVVGVVGLSRWTGMSPTIQAELLLRSPASSTVMRVLGLAKKDYLPMLLATPFEAQRPPARQPIGLSLPRGRSIVFLTVDTLRADALLMRRNDSGHPVDPSDTPYLDEFFGQSAIFTNAYAQSSKTVDSMPAMFRSLYTFENPARLGRPLGEAVADEGYRTLAVVNEWFLVSRTDRTRALFEGFERVEIYEPPDTGKAIPWALDLVDEADGAPFFLWLHLYSSHHPGFADRSLDDGDGPWRDRYRLTVRWLDGQVKLLWDGLEDRGLADDVVFVLAADHGEGLDDNGIERHGFSVFEEEIAVPLAIRAPGIPPRRIDTTVGNIDIVPTLYELVGFDPVATHRGHSLVPLLDDPQAPWPYAYYARNRYHRVLALIEGRQKLVMDTEAGVAMRFDLQRDPAEDDNLFEDDEDDRRLLFRLLRRDPAALTEGLAGGDETTRALLLERLRAIGPSTTTEELDFLLPLVPHDPRAEAAEVVTERFDAVDEPRVRLRILRLLFEEDPARWAERMVAWLEASDDPESIVVALAAQGQPIFASSWVAGRLSERLSRGIDPALPWLELVVGWKTVASDDFAAPITKALHAAKGQRRAAVAGLRAARHLEGLEAGSDALRALGQAIVPFIDDGDPTVEVVAVRALARDPAHNPRLAALVDDQGRDLRVRQAALRAVGHAQGEAAIGFIEHAARNPRMTIVSLLLLSEIAGDQALDALERLRNLPMNEEDRKQFVKALRTVRRINAAQRAR